MIKDITVKLMRIVEDHRTNMISLIHNQLKIIKDLKNILFLDQLIKVELSKIIQQKLHYQFMVVEMFKRILQNLQFIEIKKRRETDKITMIEREDKIKIFKIEMDITQFMIGSITSIEVMIIGIQKLSKLKEAKVTDLILIITTHIQIIL